MIVVWLLVSLAVCLAVGAVVFFYARGIWLWIVALEDAVRELYDVIADGADGHGGDRDEGGVAYEVGEYITDERARMAAREAVYGVS